MRLKYLRCPEADAGAGSGDGKSKEAAPKPEDLAKQIAELTAKNKEYEDRIAKLSKDNEGDANLLDKARKEREMQNKKTSDYKALENALKFGLKSEEFIKTNASLLPKDVPDIFKQAEKEKYADALEKDSAIKSGIVQSFFSIQANVDLLTPGLKSSLDDYLALTKTQKQERAREAYDNIFEPAFEMLKRIKKAEQINRGYSDEGDMETAYKNKMIALSKKHYLGEK